MRNKNLKILCLLLALSAVLLLFGCGEDKQPQNTNQQANQQQNNGPIDGQETKIPGYSEDDQNKDGVDFNLQPEGDVDFTPTENSDKMYTVEDGFAYELDPITLEKVGPPLDPITKEPLEQVQSGDAEENEEEQNNVGGNYNIDNRDDLSNGEQTEDLDNSESEESLTNKDLKLPNTGIFLEDD